MLPLKLLGSAGAPLTILCLGAHCDDIEIGCGATLLWLAKDNPDHRIHWMICCSSEGRKREAMDSARRFLGDAAQERVIIHGFRDGFLPYLGQGVKDCFESLKPLVQPDLILTHYRHDLHQDHRLVSELTLNTYRDHLILEYEVPKYDGDLGNPNCYVQVDEDLVERKIRYLREAYSSQAGKSWFEAETFRGLMRLRGMESASTTRYAEAFYARKTVLRFS